MSEQAVVALILGVLAIIGGGGFWGYRQFTKEAPVKKRDADIAAADTSVQMALSVATAAAKDSVTLRELIGEERTQRERLSGRVESLETHVREQERTIRTLRAAIGLLTDWGNDIVARWNVIRLQDKPPPMPSIRHD